MLTDNQPKHTHIRVKLVFPHRLSRITLSPHTYTPIPNSPFYVCDDLGTLIHSSVGLGCAPPLFSAGTWERTNQMWTLALQSEFTGTRALASQTISTFQTLPGSGRRQMVTEWREWSIFYLVFNRQEQIFCLLQTAIHFTGDCRVPSTMEHPGDAGKGSRGWCVCSWETGCAEVPLGS